MKRRIIIALLLLSVSIGFVSLTERGASARWAVPNPVVTNLSDSGAGSLRQAISDADAGGTITFQPGLTGTITLSSELGIDKNLTIQGPGANLLTVSGNDAVRVFNVTADNVTLSGLTIANGRLTEANNFGGGIHHRSAGTLTLQQCTLSGNSLFGSGTTYNVGAGGGIYNAAGTVNLTACTLSGNSASASGSDNNVGSGGGIYNVSGTINLTACTLSGNSASGGGHGISRGAGGAIYNERGAVTLTACTLSGNSAFTNGGGVVNVAGATTVSNTIIAGNTAGVAPDVNGPFNSQGYNLIGKNDGSTGFDVGNPNANQDIVGTIASPINSLLSPLANNGGPTKTMALLPGSPAIDKGKSFNLSTDQRGEMRPVDNVTIPQATGGDNSDIGAFESQDTGNSVPIVRCHAITVFAEASCSANASIDKGSYDPDSGDSITLTQSPAGPYPLGTTTVTLTVTDSYGASSSCIATVTVVDNTAPTLTLNGANPMTVECAYGFIDPGATATDNCAASLAVTSSGSVNMGVLGSYTITYTANDGHGNITTKTRTVNVVDGTAPTLTLKPDAQLWPLDHTYRTLTISQMVQSLGDACNTGLSLNDVKIEKVTSDEPDDLNGSSDTVNDILIAADCRSVQLRAECEGKNGRVYIITLRARDASGNTTRKDFRVNVPISQSGVAVQDATAQTKTGSCP